MLSYVRSSLLVFISIHCQYPYVCSRWSSWLYLTCNCQYWLSFLSVHSLDVTARCLNREWYILMFNWIKSILLFIYLFFQVFYFRTYLDIVILGTLHRLLLLPVTLSYVKLRWPSSLKSSSHNDFIRSHLGRFWAHAPNQGVSKRQCKINSNLNFNLFPLRYSTFSVLFWSARCMVSGFFLYFWVTWVWRLQRQWRCWNASHRQGLIP